MRCSGCPEGCGDSAFSCIGLCELCDLAMLLWSACVNARLVASSMVEELQP